MTARIPKGLGMQKWQVLSATPPRGGSARRLDDNSAFIRLWSMDDGSTVRPGRREHLLWNHQ